MSERQIYPASRACCGGDTLCMAKDGEGKCLIVSGGGEAYETLIGAPLALPEGAAKRCPLSNRNAALLRELLPFTRPSRHKGKPFTIGLGDRLGIASPGHLRLLAHKNADAFPVLAQQSARELTLTGRTNEDVLAAAVWAVFQEGWRGGYGADGDHLKTPEEVQNVIDCGYTMVTLDCSAHIRNDRGEDPEAIYGEAVAFAADIYHKYLRGKDIDFELSIDETAAPTTPEAHLYVANKLRRAGVELVTLAPRFCGEFQKGIDYIGDLADFEEDFKRHACIAREGGYKLSIHSGSDKLSVFPIIFRHTGGNAHLKTAGTSWLEALRVVAEVNPELFRSVVLFALANLAEAKQYYHTTENTANIPDIDTLPDSALPGLLCQNDSRQALHISYGSVLSAKDPGGAALYKDALYAALNANEDKYYAALYSRISLHLPPRARADAAAGQLSAAGFRQP
ncbi:MAG: tagaturonate epimerase family protein [Oscillospiraceae bacterium]|jgi:hypothetical protein|nr:tagaturonate epimerase family protein [Oscillospiraceae bacterium]